MLPVIPAVGITSATKLAFNAVGNGGGSSCSVGVFPDADTGARLATTGAISCNGGGNKSATGLTAFSLTAGTVYRVCICGSGGAAGTYIGVNAQTGGGTNSQQSLLNAFVTSAGTGAVCVAGAQPATTGALTAATTGDPPIVLISVE